MVTAHIGFDVGDEELQMSLVAALAAVEDKLRTAVKSDDPLVSITSRYLIDAGGKRFRPLLTLLASHLGDPQASDIQDAAVVVELTHLATLYHDDVMDEAGRRRGAASANARWDNTVAILTGDFLFARASDIVSELGTEAVRIQARTFARLVTGQIRETAGPLDGQDAVAHHLAVLADKTGSLIATAGRFGAMFAGCDERTIEIMTRFGERIGVAFQLADDLVDIGSESVQSGKTPGTDLREGVLTLPALLVMESSDPADQRLRDLLARPLVDDDDHAEALAALRNHEAMQRARAIAQDWATQARLTLEPLPAGPVPDALSRLCGYVVQRTG